MTTKTDSLHNLSERLMRNQKQLKDKRQHVGEKLHYFVAFEHLYDSVDRNSKRVNHKEFLSVLDNIDDAMQYLNNHVSIFHFVYNYQNTMLHIFIDELQRGKNI